MLPSYLNILKLSSLAGDHCQMRFIILNFWNISLSSFWKWVPSSITYSSGFPLIFQDSSKISDRLCMNTTAGSFCYHSCDLSELRRPNLIKVTWWWPWSFMGVHWQSPCVKWKLSRARGPPDIPSTAHTGHDLGIQSCVYVIWVDTQHNIVHCNVHTRNIYSNLWCKVKTIDENYSAHAMRTHRTETRWRETSSGVSYLAEFNEWMWKKFAIFLTLSPYTCTPMNEMPLNAFSV